MKRKLLKKIALFAMTAALCVGAFVPVTVKAAEVSASSLAGDWYCEDYDGMTWSGITSDGMLHFKEDGTYKDMWGHSKAYHMEAGSLNIEGETVSYDVCPRSPVRKKKRKRLRDLRQRKREKRWSRLAGKRYVWKGKRQNWDLRMLRRCRMRRRKVNLRTSIITMR